MNEKWVGLVVSAVVGGVVGVAASFLVGGKTKFDSLEVADLKITKSAEVPELTITNFAKLVNDEGTEDVVIREGSVFVNNVILGKKFVGTQYQGHVFVANRIFTSPDNLVVTPMEQWKFFTEIGSSLENGGEMIIRSVNGPNLVGQKTSTGAFLRVGFNPTDNFPEMYARSNVDCEQFPVPFLKRNVIGPAQPGSPASPTDAAAAAAAGLPDITPPIPETPETAARGGETIQ